MGLYVNHVVTRVGKVPLPFMIKRDIGRREVEGNNVQRITLGLRVAA
jgi:hypothetical protein